MKINRLHKILSAITVTTLSVTMLVGCGASDPNNVNTWSKKELVANYTALSQSYAELSAKNNDLNVALQALSNEGKVTAAISMVGDGENARMSFNSNDSKIIFPVEFVYPKSQEIAPDGKINITSNVSIKPASTWISRINGSALEVQQTSTKISGMIKINQATEIIPVEQMEEQVFQPWFDNTPFNVGVKYTNIFMGQAATGKQAENAILIDSENAYLICGMATSGGYTITYVFVYRGSEDATKTEAVKTLLNTIEVAGTKLTVQN